MPLRISETEFFCEFSDESKSKLLIAVLYVVLDGFVNEEGEKTQEVAALAYGYSGGSTQSDYLFRRDGNNSLWLYSDSSGGEWKGAKTTPKGSHLYTEDAACPEWSEQDAQCQNILEGLWDDYFCIGDDGEVGVHPGSFEENKQSETIAHSEGFDMDHLWDISPITNLTTQYRDPYYENQ